MYIHKRYLHDAEGQWKVVGGMLAHVKSLKECLDHQYLRRIKKKVGYNFC